MNSKKRFAIYVFFDIDGIADNYQFTLLNDLKKNIDKLLIVINGNIDDESLNKFKNIADDVLQRKNKGFDTMAYKDGLYFYKKEELSKFDEIIMMNDTVYGPVYPFSEMFEEMDKHTVLDFWGITMHQKTDHDPFHRLKWNYIPRHIQTYFLAVRKNLFMSDAFWNYWKNMVKIDTYLDAVCKHEVVFTKTFEEMGYKWSIYVDTSTFSSKIENYSFYYPKELIQKYRCPIFKRRVFFNSYEAIYPVSFGQPSYELFKYVKYNTSYDENLILENLIRIKNQYDLYQNLKLTKVLPSNMSKLTDNAPFKKVALIMHIYFDDLVDYCLEYAKSMPEYADIIITTNKDSIKNDILQKKDRIICNELKVRVIPNRGRSESAILVAVKDIVMNYDIVCFAHDKKSLQVKPALIGESFSYKCFENILGSKDYVNNILNLFKENKHIGLACPTPPNAAEFYSVLGCLEWGPNFEVTKNLLEDLNVKVPLSEEKPPMSPLGGMFWFRPKALKAFYDRNFDYDDFPLEPIEVNGTMLHAIERAYPLVAQYHGYYTMYITKDDFVSLDLINLSYYVGSINSIIYKKYGLPPSLLLLVHYIASGNKNHFITMFIRIKNRFKVFVVKTFPKPFVKFCKRILRLK